MEGKGEGVPMETKGTSVFGGERTKSTAGLPFKNN
jgi:hypothetical protein